MSTTRKPRDSTMDSLRTRSESSGQLWDVHRQDDNGNRFVMEIALPRAEAELILAIYEARHHKQTYWLSPTLQ
jgi:hypothetical protein